MNVVFDHHEDISTGLKTFWFKPERRVDYLAGQFTELYLPHPGADARGERRWFTISSSPTDKLVSITTTFAPQGSSFKRELRALKPGTALKLADPMGDFVLPKDASLPLIFVAGGAGITPVHSMIKYLHDTNEKRTTQLMYAAHSADELSFMPLFTSYITKLSTMLSPQRLTSPKILKRAPDDGRSVYYISGPEPMVEAFTKELAAAGIAPHRIVSDYFPGYARF